MGSSVPDIPGTKADPALAGSFRYEVRNLLGRNNTTFPGAQPVSFMTRHLEELSKEYYYVCEKTDGIRCLMYLTHDQDQEVVYLIDRKNDYYHVPNLHFPPKGDNVAAFHINTLLDGELVNDRELDGSLKMKYFVFDCLVLDGKSLIDRILDKRLGYFRQEILDPYNQLYHQYPQELQYVPFELRAKEMFPSYSIQNMFENFIPALKHDSDGLIFTCRNSPYTPGTDPHILKWKMEDENSIDFRMHLEIPTVYPDSEDEEGPYPDYTAIPKVHLTVFGGEARGDVRRGMLALTAPEWEGMKARNEPLDERIVECTLDQAGEWRFLRFRDDKQESNHESTADSVMASINDCVTKEQLISYQGKIKDAWKARQKADEISAKKSLEPRRAVASATQQKCAGVQNGVTVNGFGGTEKKAKGNDQSVAAG